MEGIEGVRTIFLVEIATFCDPGFRRYGGLKISNEGGELSNSIFDRLYLRNYQSQEAAVLGVHNAHALSTINWYKKP